MDSASVQRPSISTAFLPSFLPLQSGAEISIDRIYAAFSIKNDETL
ncbi:MAG: hypothetical protein FIO02_07575 [Nitrosopumilales archaeon]|nr:hypothetical protein [Nitrosopumilales archaeon]